MIRNKLLKSLVLVPVALAAGTIGRAAWRTLAAMAAGAATVLVAVAGLGFWWLDGLATTRRLYWESVADVRPTAYLALAGNPGVLFAVVGPAVVAGLFLRQHRPAALLSIGAVAAVVLADASLLSKGEVERIWLPFVPWLAVVAPGHRRGWLAAQAAVALALEAVLVTPW